MAVVVMGIAAIAFIGLTVIPPLTEAFQGNSRSTTPSPTASGTAQEDLEAQARGYELVLQREPSNQTALRGLVDIRIQQGNIEAVVAPLEKLAELNPGQAEYSILLAQVKQRTGDREGAAQAYRTILETRPGDINALQGMVNLMLEQQRPEAAIGLLQDTLRSADAANKIQPGSVDVVSVELLLARVYAEQERFDEAIALYDKAIEAAPEDFRPIFGKAMVLQAQGQDEEAQSLFASASSLAPPQFKDQINQIAAEGSPEEVPEASADTDTDPSSDAAPSEPSPATAE